MNFSNANLAKIETNWQAIKTSLERAVDLANSFGIDRDNLLSANAIIPIAYYLFQQDTDLRGTSAFEVRNAEAIRRWLTASLLNNAFGGSSDTALAGIRLVLQQNANQRPVDFPIDAIDGKLGESGRSSRFDESSMDSFLHITYGTRSCFLGLSLLRDDRSWGTITFHQDHIFPRSLFTPRTLTEAGVPASEQSKYVSCCNQIANLQLLTSSENAGKSNQDFSTWLTTRDREYKAKHLIPEDEALYSLNNFLEFCAAREELIKSRLRDLLSSTKIAEVA